MWKWISQLKVNQTKVSRSFVGLVWLVLCFCCVFVWLFFFVVCGFVWGFFPNSLGPLAHTAKHSEKVVSENCIENCILITVIYRHNVTSMIPK